jgi:hypothetical protein
MFDKVLIVEDEPEVRLITVISHGSASLGEYLDFVQLWGIYDLPQSRIALARDAFSRRMRAYMLKVARMYFHAYRRKLVSASSLLIVPIQSLRLSARSLGVRLITCTKDRCVATWAKSIADRFACRNLGLVEARGYTATW